MPLHNTKVEAQCADSATRTIRPISFADTANSEMYTGQIPAQFLEKAIWLLPVGKCNCPHIKKFTGHHAYHF
jgi:hypothetical protein